MLDRFDPKLDPTFAAPDRARLIGALKAALPADGLLTAPEAMAVYECDGLAAYRGQPGLVALPRNAEEVRRTLTVCNNLGVPVVARGAGTGLSGGALPFPGCVLLSLSRMNRILGVDPQERLARV